MKKLLILIMASGFATPVGADDLKAGRDLIKEWGCIECHGLSGNNRSTKTRVIPMLAGQPAAFLVKRLEEYQSGLHKDLEDWSKMGNLVQGLTENEMQLISRYYEAQKRY